MPAALIAITFFYGQNTAEGGCTRGVYALNSRMSYNTAAFDAGYRVKNFAVWQGIIFWAL